jgi:hypothetical protein
VLLLSRQLVASRGAFPLDTLDTLDTAAPTRERGQPVPITADMVPARTVLVAMLAAVVIDDIPQVVPAIAITAEQDVVAR